MDQEQQTPRYADDTQTGMNLLYLLASAWAITIYLPLRKGTGKEHCGIRGVVGFCWPFLACMVLKDITLLYIVPVYFISLLAHRAGHLRDFWAGRIVHTQYSGEPWLAWRLSPHVSEQRAKAVVEPLFVVCCSLGLLLFSPGLGLYYFWGGIVMAAKQGFDNMAWQKQLDQQRDAQIEAGYLAAQARRGLRWR